MSWEYWIVLVIAPILVYILVRVSSAAVYRSRLDYEKARDKVPKELRGIKGSNQTGGTKAANGS